MYKVYIGGTYAGSFRTSEEAMECVADRARPYRKSWEIKDPYNRVFAQG